MTKHNDAALEQPLFSDCFVFLMFSATESEEEVDYERVDLVKLGSKA